MSYHNLNLDLQARGNEKWVGGANEAPWVRDQDSGGVENWQASGFIHSPFLAYHTSIQYLFAPAPNWKNMSNPLKHLTKVGRFASPQSQLGRYVPRCFSVDLDPWPFRSLSNYFLRSFQNEGIASCKVSLKLIYNFDTLSREDAFTISYRHRHTCTQGEPP